MKTAFLILGLNALFIITSLQAQTLPMQTQDSKEPEAAQAHNVIPLALRYVGTGNILGAAYVGQLNEQWQVAAGLAGLDISAAGIALRYTPSEVLRVNVDIVPIFNATPEAAFSRDVSTDIERYYQEIQASTYGVRAGYDFSGFLLEGSLRLSDIEFKKFYNESRDEIELPSIHITPLSQTIIGLKAGYTFGDESPLKSRDGIFLEYLNRSASSGYNADSVLTGEIGKVFKFSDFSIGLKSFYSEAQVEGKKYTDFDEVEEILAIQCETLTDAGQAEECLKLERDLTYAVVSHNLYGNARTLGGYYMRAYPEGRFKASKTFYIGGEADYIFSKKKYIPGLFFCLEAGYASDDSAKLTDRSVSSVCGGLKWNFGELNLALTLAASDDRTELSLTVR